MLHGDAPIHYLPHLSHGVSDFIEKPSVAAKYDKILGLFYETKRLCRWICSQDGSGEWGKTKNLSVSMCELKGPS